MTIDVELQYGQELEILPGIVVKPIKPHGTEARIGIQAPRHIAVVKAESMDPDVIEFRRALALIAEGVR